MISFLSFVQPGCRAPQHSLPVPNQLRARLQRFAAVRDAAHPLSVKHIAAKLEMGRIAAQLAARLFDHLVTEDVALQAVEFSEDFAAVWMKPEPKEL